MPSKRCSRCVGSGTVMGGGMMMSECYDCDGTGKIKEEKITEVMSKESEEYKKAKERIKSLDENMTEDQAEKLLDEELDKQENVTVFPQKKRGRPKVNTSV